MRTQIAGDAAPRKKKVTKKTGGKKPSNRPIDDGLDPVIGESTSIFQQASGGEPRSRHFAQPPNLKRGFEVIIAKLFDEGFDVLKEYQLIEDSLRIKGALTPGAVAAATNNAEDMARRAYRLYIVAVAEHESFVRETDSIVGAMRDGATAELEVEKRTMVKDSSGKEKPLRSKLITDADVVAKASQLYPDEWLEVASRRTRAEGMKKMIENLAELAKSRCFTVRRLGPNGEA